MNIGLKDVSYHYEDGTQALQQVCLQIRQGERIVLLGENGAGKSTLFHLLTGLVRPTAGEVLIEGKAAGYHGSRLHDWRKNVGYVFQDPDIQLVSMTVFQEVAYGPLNLGLSPGTVRERTRRTLAQTGIEALEDRPVHFLSYGQKKLVSIADVLVMEPQVILLDEPTAWLDARHADRVMELLDGLHAQGKTIVLSTHDVELAYRWADRAILLSRGRVVLDGPVREVMQQKPLVTAAGLRLPFLLQLEQTLKDRGCSMPDGGLPVCVTSLVQVLGEMFPLTGKESV